MQEALPGYDTSYRSGTNSAVDAAITDLNRILIPVGGGIACLNEKGEKVQRYTDRVVLEIPEGAPNEIATAARAAALKVLQVMNKNTSSRIAEEISSLTAKDKSEAISYLERCGKHGRLLIGGIEEYGSTWAIMANDADLSNPKDRGTIVIKYIKDNFI